jgi:hypothetical protein
LGGQIKLVSKTLANHFRCSELSPFYDIEVEERGRWLVPFDVCSLVKRTRQVLAGNLLLAGKAVMA